MFWYTKNVWSISAVSSIEMQLKCELEAWSLELFM